MFTRSVTEIQPVKVLTLCQRLTDRMGLEPILPVKVTITIDTMLKLNGPNFGDGLVVGVCEQGLGAHQTINYFENNTHFT